MTNTRPSLAPPSCTLSPPMDGFASSALTDRRVPHLLQVLNPSFRTAGCKRYPDLEVSNLMSERQCFLPQHHRCLATQKVNSGVGPNIALVNLITVQDYLLRAHSPCSWWWKCELDISQPPNLGTKTHCAAWVLRHEAPQEKDLRPRSA